MENPQHLIDLHTHTNVSDGDHDPLHLVEIAAERGVGTMSITDHDTVDGYTDALNQRADNLGVRIIPGTELSTIDRQTGQKVHVLGLFVDVSHKGLVSLCRELRESREHMAREVERKLGNLGFVMSAEKLISTGNIITKANIAEEIIKDQANQSMLIEHHGAVPSKGEFIERWLIKGQPAFVPNPRTLHTDESIDVIHEAGGVASCAHPGFNVMKGFPFDDMTDLIIRNEFDAVEAINIQYDRSRKDKRVDLVGQFTSFAAREGLLISGGSDYHSDNEEYWGRMSHLGLSDEQYRIEQAHVDALESRAKEYRS